MSRNLLLKSFLFAVFVISLVSVAKAQTSSDSDKRLVVKIGGHLLTGADTRARLDLNDHDLGTEIGLERDLGLPSTQGVFRIDSSFRFARRHSFAFGYYKISRDTSKRIKREIKWGELIFPIDANIQTRFETDILKFAYRFSFVHREKAEISASIGVHWMKPSAVLGLESRVPYTGEAQFSAPLPVIGVHGRYALSHKLNLKGGFQFFKAKVGDVDGHIIDFLLGLEHNTFKHLGFGGGLNIFDLDVDLATSRWRGKLNMNYYGLLLYGKFYF